MCKLFCVLDIENQNEVEKFITKAVPFVTKTDNDGLGLMRLGEKGVYIQRWLDIPKKLETSPKFTSKYKSLLRVESNEVGKRSQRLDAIAIHGRLATCGVSLENTHPFYLEGTALIHNGIITNGLPTDNIISSCDSETLLHRYMDNNIKTSPNKLTEALSNVSGYYASIVFNDNGIVDIWNDDQAPLVLAYVQGIGNVIATNEEIIYRTSKACKKRVVFCYPVLAFTHLRWERNRPPVIGSFSKPLAVFVSTKGETEAEKWKALTEFDKDQEQKWWQEEYKESQLLKKDLL